MNKEDTIIYDIISVPNGINMDTLHKIWTEHKWLFWDSSNEGNEPKLLSGNKLEISLDISIPKNRKLLDKIKKELKS